MSWSWAPFYHRTAKNQSLLRVQWLWIEPKLLLVHWIASTTGQAPRDDVRIKYVTLVVSPCSTCLYRLRTRQQASRLELSILSHPCVHTRRPYVSILSILMSGKFHVLINSSRFIFQAAWYPSTLLDEKDRHQETETCPCCWCHHWKDGWTNYCRRPRSCWSIGWCTRWGERRGSRTAQEGEG